MQLVPITAKVVRLNIAHAGALETTLCDQSLSVTCDSSVGFSEYSVSYTNNTDLHDITEILLKVVLNTITLILTLESLLWKLHATN